MSLVFNQKITLDMTVSRVQNVHCSQDDDNSRNILITLSDNGKPYSIPSEVSIFLKISKPDDTYVYIDEDDSEHLYRNDDGTISVILSDQATCVSGICEAELQFMTTDKTISTRKFNIIVKKSVVSNEEIESTIESNVLKKLIYHLLDFNNPHKVDKNQVGLGNVPNVTTNDQTPTYEEAEEFENISSGEKLSTAFGKIKRAITSLIAHINNLDNPHKTTKKQIELGNVDNTSDVDKPVSTAQQKAIDDAYANSNKYTDQKVADLIDGAPETLDTLKEVADAIEKSKTVEEALNNAIGKKANQTELDTHTGNDTIHITSDERTKWNDANDKKHFHDNKSILDGITSELVEKWTETSSSSVTGIKGAAETEYRKGNVEIGLKDIASMNKYTGNIDELLYNGQGIYYIDAQSATGTQPTSGWYVLEVLAANTLIIMQIACVNDGRQYSRIYASKKWSAWIYVAEKATKATQDGKGQQIDSTYIKSLSVNGDTISYTKGDGTGGNLKTLLPIAGTGLASVELETLNSITGITINHSNNITAGTAGTSSATSGATLAVPYVTYDAQGHVTKGGTHTHTITGFALSNHTHSYLPLAGGTLTGTLILSKKMDASGTDDNRPALIVGGEPTAVHIEIDSNEIQGKANGTTVNQVSINADGGAVNIGKKGDSQTTIKNQLEVCEDLLADGNVYINEGKWILCDDSKLIGKNTAANIHMGDYAGGEISPVYLHANGMQYDFLADAFRAHTTNKVSIGTSGYLFTTVFAKTGTINTSDRTKKHDINDLTEVYEKLFLMLQPKSFVFNDGDRVHIGAISQDVEDAMQKLGIEPEKFAGFCKDIRYEYTEFSEEDGMPVESSKVPCKDEDGNIIYDYALRYQEFIFLTIHMVQKLWARTEALENENKELTKTVNDFKARLTKLETTTSA